MQLGFEMSLADQYRSSTQKVRILSENWVQSQAYCPSCGSDALSRYCNNQPVADFFCSICKEDFELKSQRGKMGPIIVDGAYRTMIARISSNQNPSFFLLTYERANPSVSDFVVIPKQFFTPPIIVRRKPLSQAARRKGWVGCNIRLCDIPASGRIALVSGGRQVPKNDVMEAWRRMLFLRDTTSPQAKGWLLSVMGAIDALGRVSFSLNDLYDIEEEFRMQYPGNANIRPKIRQQLQILRDKGYIIFAGNGSYSLVSAA